MNEFTRKKRDNTLVEVIMPLVEIIRLYQLKNQHLQD